MEIDSKNSGEAGNRSKPADLVETAAEASDLVAGLAGAELIAQERRRQIEAEGWTPEHDDEHVDGELAQAAACYAWPAPRPIAVKKAWPWELRWWKPRIAERVPVACGCRSAGECNHFAPPTADAIKNARIRDLVKAGALIAAEIDRLTRKRQVTATASAHSTTSR